MEPDDQPSMLRIGELSRRVGVSDHVLRAWETRYGLLTPERSPGGFRLYSDSDEHRIRRMQYHLAQGCRRRRRRVLRSPRRRRSLRRRASRPCPTDVRSDLHELARSLQRALDDFDEAAAQTVLDRLLSDFTLATSLRDVVLPIPARAR